MSEKSGSERLREQAFQRVKKRRDFWPHLLVYLMVNTLVVVVWFMTDQGGFFWPIFLIAAWGIGVVMHAWEAFLGTQITDEDVDREIARMQHR